MNRIAENPFVFFIDNAHEIFPMDVYQDVGKIIELSDTGCDAISPSSSIEQKNDEKRRKISDEKGNNKQRISSASRPPQKQKENKSKIVSNDVTDNAKTSRKDKLKDFNGGKRKTIDRAIDKDSLSNNSDVFGIFEENMKNNLENLNKGKSKFNTKEPNDEKSRENINRQRFNREMNNKTISKSADFDKSKHRANMLKRYPNKSWIKSSTNNSSTIPKIQEKQTILDKKHFHNALFVNNNSKPKVISNSAGSSFRRVEEIQKEKIKSEEKINMASSFDDNSDTWNKSTNNLINRSKNKNRISGNSLPRSVRKERENDKVDIERKDLEKIGAIFLASSLRKSGKLANSKINDNDDHNSKNNKSDQLETNKMEKGLSKTEKSMKSRIPIAISRMKKELEDNFDYFKLKDCNRSRSRLRSRSIVTETDRSNENKIDESTSTAIILIDKSDCTRDENNENDDRNETRLNSFNTKLEESRKRKLDVESKVFKIANDVKEKRRQKFEKCALREPFKKFTNESQEIVDIAVTILEKDTKGKRKSSNGDCRFKNNYRNYEEIYSKPYSLRSGMYSKYLHNK